MNNQEMLLLKLGEVVLKGLNRRSFEDKLVNTVRRRMKNYGSFQVYVRQSTIYVEPQKEDCDMDAAYKAAKQVFGVVQVARAVPCEKSVEAIDGPAGHFRPGGEKMQRHERRRAADGPHRPGPGFRAEGADPGRAGEQPGF